MRILPLALVLLATITACDAGHGPAQPVAVPTTARCADAAPLRQQAADDRTRAAELSSDQERMVLRNRAGFFASLAIVADLQCTVTLPEAGEALKPAFDAARKAAAAGTMYERIHGWAEADFAATRVIAMLVESLRPGGSGQGSDNRTDELALVELQQSLARAWVSGDRAAIERIIAPDWSSTGPDGKTTDRAAVLTAVFETRRHKIRRLEIDDVTARVFGDAAVVTGRTHGVGEAEGAAYDVVIRFTDTFVRREGRWQAVASHAGVLPGRQ